MKTKHVHNSKGKTRIIMDLPDWQSQMKKSNSYSISDLFSPLINISVELLASKELGEAAPCIALRLWKSALLPLNVKKYSPIRCGPKCLWLPAQPGHSSVPRGCKLLVSTASFSKASMMHVCQAFWPARLELFFSSPTLVFSGVFFWTWKCWYAC